MFEDTKEVVPSRKSMTDYVMVIRKKDKKGETIVYKTPI